jgi:hypothetical protein
LVKVTGPPLIGLDWDYTGPRWMSAGVDSDGELMFGAAYLGGNFWGETTVAPGDLHSIEIEVYAVESYDDANGNGAYDIGEIYTVNPDSGQIANFYQTWGAGAHQKSDLVDFKVFDVDVEPRRQLSVIVRDRDENGQWDPDAGSEPRYNYVFILDDDYDPTGDNWNPNAGGRDFMDEIILNGGPVMWVMWWGPRGDLEQFAESFHLDFIAPKVNTDADVFSFTATSSTQSDELAMQDIEKMNVFPNPYYGVNSEEINKYNRFVTFTHLPEKAKIRIFNLAGVLVSTIEKDDPGQYQRWDLANDDGLPVASGLYIAYIELPDLGTTKILKVAVIQEQQILDRF